MSRPRGSVEARLVQHTDRSGGPEACWPWTGARNHDGYGIIQMPTGTSGGRSARAHRVAWAIANGREPVGTINHTCDNPPCCNPSHLYDGNMADNVRDREQRGRANRDGLKLSPEARKR